ncbi:hypothetical protein S83_055024, partial [Arachis hypogaea]
DSDPSKRTRLWIILSLVVGIEGHNPSGHCLVASKLVDSIPPTSVADDKDLNPAKKLAIDKSQPIDITSKKTELSMIIAAGPFTTTDNLFFEPLVEFSGEIPNSLGGLKNLNYLQLNNNSLTGLCPQSLSNIEGLTLVDLSYNNLSGSLPRIPARTLNLVLQTNQELDHDEKLNRVIAVYRDQRIIGANCKVIDGEVDIWEQRRVFGSRAKNLKDLMLAEEAPTPLQFSKKRSRSGSPAEKIVSAFHSVLTEQSIEDAEMSKSKSAIQHMKKMESDVDIACSIAKDPKRKPLSKELQKEENTLKQCVEKLKLVEANRVVLVSHLKEALHEQ